MDLQPKDVAGIDFFATAAVFRPECTQVDIYSAMRQSLTLNMGAESYRWWIGDIANQATEIFGDEGFQAIHDACQVYDISTVNTWMRVSKNVPPENRYPWDVLSWSVHKDVSILPVDEQRDWLEQAASNKWKSRDVREKISAHRIAQLMASVPEDKKEYWGNVLEVLEPGPREFRAMIEGRKDVVFPKTFDEWVGEKVDDDTFNALSKTQQWKSAWMAAKIHEGDKKCG